MIVRELGIVVGKIDDDTFELIDSESDKLTTLMDDWLSNGIDTMHPQKGELEKAQISGDVFVTARPDNEFFIDVLRNNLLIQGFEVQTA